MSEYMVRRYHERRIEAIAILGGKCIQCNTSQNLEIDHIDPRKKAGSIGKMFSGGKTNYLKELKKCQLLCNDCHKNKTKNTTSVEHGEGKTGKKNCYCDLCKPLKQKYQRDNVWKWKH